MSNATSPTAATTTTTALVDYLLSLADDNLVVAQRLGEMVSKMPDLETDIASANIGLDHLGAARALYGHAASIQAASGQGGSPGDAVDEDALAMGRSERDFRNAVLVEQPNTDFAWITARQLFLDAYQVPLYAALESSADETLAAIAAKASKEARYHLRHSSMWAVRLGDGTPESHDRMQAAVDGLWRFADDLFEMPSGTESLIAAGIAADPASVRTEFDATVAAVLAEATIVLPEDPYQRLGGRTGMHTEHLGHLLTEMQWLYRSHPGAEW